MPRAWGRRDSLCGKQGGKGWTIEKLMMNCNAGAEKDRDEVGTKDEFGKLGRAVSSGWGSRRV